MRTLFSGDPKGSAPPSSPPETKGEGKGAPVRAAPKRRTIFLPFTSWVFLGIALGLLIISVHRRINLLMLLGDVLVVIALWNLLAAGRSVRGLRGRRRFDDWLFARTPCIVELQVSNPDRRPRQGIRIDEEGQSAADSQSGTESVLGAPALSAAAWMVDCLPALGSVSCRRQVVPPRRGRFTWAEAWASSAYPFGLVGRSQRLAAEEAVTVFPCLGWVHRGRLLRHVRSLTLLPRHTQLRQKPQPHTSAQDEFHGLREYRSSDSPRLIHWRTSARRGQLMVREFEDEPSENLLLIVDPTLPPPPSSPPNMGEELRSSPPMLGGDEGGGGVQMREQFEEMISLAASICWEWCRRRGDRLILATATAEPTMLDGLTGPVHARRLLECLAVLECRPSPIDGTVIQRLQMRRLPVALVVVVALGRSALADPLRRALGRRVHCLDATRTDRLDFYTPPK